MEHIAIDLGGRKSQVCVRSHTGEVVEESRLDTRMLGAFLLGRPESRVVLETCAEAFSVADLARQAGHEIRVVPSSLVRSLGVGGRGVKTDKHDARVISEVSTRIDLPSVYVPSLEARRRKALCSSHEVLVSSRTKLINHCRGWLRTQGATIPIPSGSSSTFPARMRQAHPNLPMHLEGVLAVIELLTTQLKQLDEDLAKIADNDAVCVRLMSVPGVGPQTSIRFVAAIGELERFEHSDTLQSYFGLVPGERSSGDKKHRTSLTKAGSSAVRWLLTQAAWSAWRNRPNDPMVRWAKQVALRRGKNVAVVALARKIAGILFALWRDQRSYDPSRGSNVQLLELEEGLRAVTS